MIPKWKVARELDRANQQIKSLLGRLWEPFVQWSHDRRKVRARDVEAGHAPLGPKVAIFLIYQPNGIAPSTLVACRHLQEKGYSPLVVSNTPLSRRDRDQLNAVAWKTLVRPNYGYDFGGYRDGVLSLQDWGIQPERLIILNDSIWFPINEDETLIDRMEALEGDLVGAIIHPPMRRRRLSTKRQAFLESYFYLVNGTALTHSAFQRFWTKYRVSSNKLNAVYRGERGFSHAMARAGLTVAGVLDETKLIDTLRRQDDLALRKTLEHAAFTDADFESENERLLQCPGEPDWRDQVLAHVGRVVARRSFHASFPYASIGLLGTPFIKKGSGTFLKRTYGTLHSAMRTRYLAAVRQGDLPVPIPDVLLEIEAREVSVKPHTWAPKAEPVPQYSVQSEAA